MFMDANHHIQPIACHFCGEETGVDYTLLLTALMEAGFGKREYLVFNSDGSTAISMIWPSRLSWRNSTSPTTDMWYVLSISSDMLLRSWRRTRRWVQIKRDGWREECLQWTEEELLNWHARHAGTKKVCRKYIDKIKKDHPSIHEYTMDWGDSQFFYTHDKPHSSYPRHQQSLWESEWSNAIEDRHQWIDS